MSNRNGDAGGKKAAGLVRIWRALGYSLAGLAAAYRSEASFRQEIWGGLVLLPLALLLPVPLLYRAYLVGSFILVLVCELLNSAIEAVVDRVIPDVDSFAKRAKDMGSGADFLALLNLSVAWIVALVFMQQ